jgi:putative membrane protein
MIRAMTFVFAAAILTTFTPEIFAQAASPNAPDPTEGAPPGNPGVASPAPAAGVAAPAAGVAVPAAGVAVPAAGLASPNSSGTVAHGAVNDSLFAIVAATSGMSEVAISEFGKQRATDPELKRFSDRAIRDHTKLNRELTTLAAQKRIALPTQIDACGQFCLQSLAALSGAEFDGCYAKAQLVTHLQAVATFEAEAKHGTDPDVKALAAKALPIIKGHLKMIKPIAKKYHEKEEGWTSAHAQDGSRP